MKQPKTYVVCGAKNRQGEPCQRPPLAGKTRCKLHGGATPKGLKNAVKHGLYTKTLSPEEQALWSEIEVGNIENEIRMMKIMLNRAIELNAAIRQAPNDAKNLAGFELSEISKSSKGGKTDTSFTSKRPDTTAQIDRFAGRIAMLEKTRAELIAAAAVSGGEPVDAAQKLTAALKAMVEVETKQPPMVLPDDKVSDNPDADE